ncbi:SHOCT domain-containing protein [Dactylosporangium cerinum]|uniref:SHOCT domain-containing protein n=1 Tax=Dactylosporangium cerinum TaxID=1434730 RepID=A0ABV9W2X5_9ACTN
MLVFAWIWLMISILTDVFRDHSVSGWGKAGWTLFLIVLPWVGALVYLITRGPSMNERHRERVLAQDAEVREYVRSAAGTPTPSPADELGKLADLQRRGILTDAEYARAKSALLEQSQNGAGARR